MVPECIRVQTNNQLNADLVHFTRDPVFNVPTNPVVYGGECLRKRKENLNYKSTNHGRIMGIESNLKSIYFLFVCLLKSIKSQNSDID